VTATTDIGRPANVRDIGGRAVTGGGRTRTGVLVRGDQPLAGAAAPTIATWPPRTVVDLRSAHEQRGRHPLAGDGVGVHHFPILDAADPDRLAQGARADRTLDANGVVAATQLADLYLRMLHRAGPSFVEIARIVAGSPQPVLVHCAAGKDRTGVCVAILLAAAGVTTEEIVADYRLTSDNFSAVIDRLVQAEPVELRAARRARLLSIDESLLGTPDSAIRAVLSELSAARGGPGGWLVARGLGVAELDGLRDRLVER
jgi:hypothetical protein